MEKVKDISVNYEKSDSIERQGKREDIERFLKDGYHIKDERNGYWLLAKSAMVFVTLKSSDCIKQFSMKRDILNYYGRERVSEGLVNDFKRDFYNEKIAIFWDLQDNYRIE